MRKTVLTSIKTSMGKQRYFFSIAAGILPLNFIGSPMTPLISAHRTGLGAQPRASSPKSALVRKRDMSTVAPPGRLRRDLTNRSLIYPEISRGESPSVSRHKMFLHADKLAMYERASRLPQLLVTWMLVADGGQAQIYEGRKAMQSVLAGKTAGQIYSEKKSRREWVLIADGIIAAEKSQDLSTNDYDQDIMDHSQHQLIRAIASKLQSAFEEGSFDRLALIAPSWMIVELKERLDADVQNCIIGVMPRDLTDY